MVCSPWISNWFGRLELHGIKLHVDYFKEKKGFRHAISELFFYTYFKKFLAPTYQTHNQNFVYIGKQFMCVRFCPTFLAKCFLGNFLTFVILWSASVRDST